MRSLLIASLCCASVLTGCKLYHIVQSDTPQLSAADLAIKHVYKTSKKFNTQHDLTRFNDQQLQQLIHIALMDAPNMHAAKTRVIRAQHIAKGAYAALWPTVMLNGSIDQQHFSFQGTIPSPLNELTFSKLRIADLALNFNYEIDFWGKNRENLASRLTEVFAAQMDLAETRLILSSAVATAYFQLQNNIIQHHLAQENARLLQELESIVLDRAKQGIESDIPVKTAILDTQTARLSIQDYKRAELQSRHQLAVLLGKNPFSTQIETAKFTYHKKQLVLPAIIPANLLAQRPDIVAARALAESAAHQINVAKAAFFPNINLSGLLSLQSFYFSKFFDIALQTEAVKGALDLPIFDAGARRENLGVKRTDFELSINQYNQTILNALQEVSDHMSTVQTLNKQINDQNKAVGAIQANYQLFRSRYNQGIIDYVQLIEIKQSLLQQRAILYNLQSREQQAFVSLLAALGGEV